MIEAISHGRSRGARNEMRAMLSIAAPLILSELGWMAMGLVDTMFVGRVSAEAIGAISLGTTIFYTISVCAGGLLLGLETLVAQGFGAGNREDCRRSFVNGFWFTLVLIPAVMAAVWAAMRALPSFGVNPAVLKVALPYLRTLNWSAPPLLLYFWIRRYLQSSNIVRPIMIALILANVLNVAGNWILVFGNLGAPRMGAVGSAWSTFASRLLMFAWLLIVLIRHEPDLVHLNWRADRERLAALIRLGVPAATQMAFEFVVWTTATVLAGRLTADALAAHQIALATVSTTFMMPLGVSSAASVRVGQAMGRGDRPGAARSGWAAVALGSAVMSVSALGLLLFPGVIARWFTPELAVIAGAVPILRMAAFFQLFDGFQVVITGALRGLGDTRTPLLCHFGGYWMLGLPLGVLLAFGKGMGAFGLWVGLSGGVIAIGSVLLAFWFRESGGLRGAVVRD